MLFRSKADRPALDNVSLEVEKGEFVFLVGLSGSGKSTFLRLVLREERPTSGTIHVAGKDLGTLANHKVPELRRQVGTVFQDFRLLPNKTVFENVAFTLHVLGFSQKEINREVPEVLELVGLEDKSERKAYMLSGGEKRRVAIARALMQKPEILLADEIVSELDRVTAREIMDLIADAQRRINLTAIMVHHDMQLALEYANRVAVIKDGEKILEIGVEGDKIVDFQTGNFTQDEIMELYSNEP